MPDDNMDTEELEKLRKTKIVKMERHTRNLSSKTCGGPLGSMVNHHGMVATLEDGRRFLIHKGCKYGGSGGNTVATPVRNMSDEWTAARNGEVTVTSGRTVADAIDAGGRNYNMVTNNCIHACDRIAKAMISEKSFSEDMKEKELQVLFRTEIVMMETFKQKLNRESSEGTAGDPDLAQSEIYHFGQVVTLADKRIFLIHKGKAFGSPSGDTVVTHIRNKPPDYEKVCDVTVVPGWTVSDAIKAGGIDYNPVTDNSKDAADRIAKLVSRSRQMSG